MPNLREEITRTVTRITRRGASDLRARDRVDHRAGRQFGAYRILKRLGAGGMGQVYLALDTRLGRHVALKFLPPELISDHNSLMRLVQEARAASALNHPNILTIYDVGEVENEYFIVSEFVEGITLRSAMERRALAGHLPLDICIQIASALSAAHAAGVIHRDLKPTNVMLRPDGYLKVIDFGLAKVLHSSEYGSSEDLTRPGVTLGTADYMSPEQARGEAVDHRTDIWSLGVILYEIVAGRRPFEGSTQSHVLVAIQDYPVPALPADKSIPTAVQGIIVRALQKRPKDRYASAADMLYDLQAAAGSTPSGSRIRLAPPPRLKPRRRALAVAILPILLVAGVFVWWRLRQPVWLRLEPVRQLTFNGRTRLDAISPDGKYLAYTVGQPDGEQALYLKQIDSPTDELKIPPRKINYYGLTFSPDNQTLYVVEKDEAMMGRLYSVPLLGTRSTSPIIVDIDGPISFSPNGDQFTYVQYTTSNGPGGKDTVSHLWVASRDGQTRRQVISVSDVNLFRRPVWSPDGKRIAVFLERPGLSRRAFLDLVSLDGSESRREIPGWREMGRPQWTPRGKSLIVGGVRTYSDPSRRYQVFQLSVPTAADHLLTSDLAAYQEVSLSAEGKLLTAVKVDSKAIAWVSKPNDFKHGDTVPADAEVRPSLVWADPGHLVVDSRRNGYPNLALLDAQNFAFSSLTDEKYVEEDAAVIPGSGGKSIVFASNRAGYFHIWRFDADSNRLQQLSYGTTYDSHPSVSPDGRWVIYTSWSLNVPHLRKVPITGGDSVQVSGYNAQDPQISPDGHSILCYLQSPATGKWSQAIIPFGGTGMMRLLPEVSAPLSWSPEGDSISTVRTDTRGVSNVWRIPLNGREPDRLTAFEDQSILAFAWSPSGDRLACLRAIVGADVTLFKVSN